MAPIADIARLNRVRFTAQEIADLILSEDQQRRMCLEDGDLDGADRHQAEIDKLWQQMPDAA